MDFGSPRTVGLGLSLVAAILAVALVVQSSVVAGGILGIVSGVAFVLSLTVLSPRAPSRRERTSTREAPFRWGAIYAIFVIPPVFLLSCSRITRNNVGGSVAVAVAICLGVFAWAYASNAGSDG